MRPPRVGRRGASGVLAAVLLLSACSGGDDANGDAPGAAASAPGIAATGDTSASGVRPARVPDEVEGSHTLADGVVEGTDGLTPTWQPDGSVCVDGDPGVAVGDRAVVPGVVVGDVEALEERDGAVCLTVAEVPLHEAFEQALYEWTHEVDFSDDLPFTIYPAGEDAEWDIAAAGMTGTGGGSPVVLAAAGGGLTFLPGGATLAQSGTRNYPEVSGRVGEWTISLKISTSGNRLDYELKIDRFNVSAQLKGWIDGFSTSGLVEISPSAPPTYLIETQRVRGETTINWAAQEAADTLQVRVPLTVDIPLRIGLIPITLQIGVIPRVNPVITTGNGSARGSAVISYNGDQGFHVREGQVAPLGSVTDANVSFDEIVTSDTVTAGFQVGVELPKIEVSLTGGYVAAGLTIDASAAGFWEPGIASAQDPCQAATLHIKALAQFQAQLLGLTFAAEPITLWEKKETKDKRDTGCFEG